MKNKWMGAKCNQNWNDYCKKKIKKKKFKTIAIGVRVHCALWALHLKASVKRSAKLALTTVQWIDKSGSIK